jgi:16S rRNA (uracil1498-N3)-methyltransferase
MEYFYTPPDHITDTEVIIDGDEFAHLSHVMRKKVGDAVRVVDGTGNTFDTTIVSTDKRIARCSIDQRHHRLHEPPWEITLGVGILKNSSRFDFLVEKTTELGVRRIVPLLTERTIPRHARTDRWQKLALAAMKQSGRSVLPAVDELTPFADFLAGNPRASHRFLPHEAVASPTLREAGGGRPVSSVIVCVGPEGGFTEAEVTLAESAGFLPVSLGPRRLRTETAAVSSVSILLL